LQSRGIDQCDWQHSEVPPKGLHKKKALYSIGKLATKWADLGLLLACLVYQLAALVLLAEVW
jgi:hypothetical protein